MERTVLAASPYCLATRRAAALSHDSPTASSNRLLNGALLGSCGIFSAFTPQSGHRRRYNSTDTVVRYSKHGRSRTSPFIDFGDLAHAPATPGANPGARTPPHP